MKKLVAVMLSVMMLFSMLPFTIAAADQAIIINIAEKGPNVNLIGEKWVPSTTIANYDGGAHLWDVTIGDGFEVNFKDIKAGTYKVYYWRAMHENSSNKMEFTLTHDGKTTATTPVNLREGESEWVLLGIYTFSGKGDEKLVHMINQSAGNSRATAVKLEATTEAATPDVAPVATPPVTVTSKPDITVTPSPTASALPVFNEKQKEEQIFGLTSKEGNWEESTTIPNYDGGPHLWSNTTGDKASFSIKAAKAGNYKVYYWRCVHASSSKAMYFTLLHNGKSEPVGPIDLTIGDTGWVLLGVYDFAGTNDEALENIVGTGNSRLSGVKIVPTIEALSTPRPTATPKPTPNPEDTIDVEPIDGFSYQGPWQFSGALAGPMSRQPGSMWIAEEPGSSCKYDPQITASGQVRISLYKLWWPENQDPNVLYNIVHNGKTDVYYLDTSAGTGHEWITIGTYDFAGTGDEYVELVRECTEDGINTRASTVKFEIINSKTGEAGEVWQTVYVTPSQDMIQQKSMASMDQFSDMIDHWANYDVEYMAYLGYIKGKAESEFAPEDTITRAEFITILDRALGLEEEKTGVFPDVKDDDWFAGFVGAAEKAGLLKGLPVADGFKPDQPITREEIGLFVNNAIQKVGGNTQWLAKMENPFPGFQDLSSISPWAKEGLEYIVHAGIMKGVDETTLAPQETATRAQAAVMLKRFMQLFVWAGPPKDGDWELTFQDEFYGDDLDWDTWESDHSFPGHIQSSRWPENVKVEDGLCKLVTKKEERGGAQWTTASIWVKDSVFQQTYGYWEARYRYTKARGINNAWWMMTKGGGKATEKSFEIDINEGHYKNIINMTFHTGLDEKGQASANSAKELTPFDLSEDFHTYAVEWTDTELIYYFDGEEIERKTHVNAKSPVYPWLSTAVLNWAGQIGDEADGTSMDVDYVRVYQKK